MAKFTVGKGVDEYLSKLEHLDKVTPGMIGMGIYEGAKIVADAIRAETEALPTQEGKVKEGKRRDPTPEEKQGLLDGLGISKKKVTDGFVNVKIGFHGYNSHTTKKYPNGQPNLMIAASIERGTTFMNKHSFVSKAIKKSRAQAEQAIADKIDELLKKEME